MIAEVYPLKRLPRKMSHFDYMAPENHVLARGNLVEIPYRNKVIWGVVKRVKDTPPRGIELKTIQGVYDGFTLREAELSFFEWLAQDLAQSPASVLYAAVPRPPKRPRKTTEPLSWLPLTLPSSETDHVLRLVSQLGDRAKAFVQAPDLRRATAVIVGYLNKHPDQKTLILAPTKRDVELVRSRLTGMQPIVLTGDETNNERFVRWQQFRAQQHGVLLGTRTAALCVDQDVTSIFVLRASDWNFKSTERNPRFDARQVVWDQHERFSANLFLFDVAPTPNIVHRFPETELLSWGSSAPVQVIDTHKERPGKPTSSLTHSSVQAMADVLTQGGRVLCVHNRKGVARSLRCSDCAMTPTCQTCSTVLVAHTHTMECPRCRTRAPIPLRCSACNGSRLKPFGLGNQEVARELQALFPGVSVSIIDKEHEGDPNAQILVVTSFWYEAHFHPFKKLNLGLVVHIDADTPLYSTSPTAVQDLMISVWTWRSVAYACRVSYLVQTASSQLVQRILDRAFPAALDELKAREDYQLPPIYRWSRVSYRDDEPRKARIAIEQLVDAVKQINGAQSSGITEVHGRGLSVDLGVPREKLAELLAIFTALPDRYIIDTSIFNG